MRDWLADILRDRPWWMNALMFFCFYMALVYTPWDLFMKPVAQDEEIWFGLQLHGWAAKLSTPLHWFIYAAGAYGFWRMRPWMWPWAAVYAGTVAGGMFVWATLEFGWPRGIALAPIIALPFIAIAAMLWNSRARFQSAQPPMAERYGGWAVVTGASSGIGWEFARAMAREGLPCVLCARREDDLKRLAEELDQRYGVDTRVVVADLTEEAGRAKLEHATDDLDVGVIVNNAGAGYVGRLDRQDGDRLEQLVALNCLAPLSLTSKLVGRLLDRERGAIVFTGSVAGRTPLPLHAVYSATKAFNEFLGKALWLELRPFGVDVLVVEPGPVDTGFQAVAGEVRGDGDAPAHAVVETALDALGRQPTVVHGWGLMVGSWFARVLPSSLVLYLTRDQTARLTPREMR